MIESARCIQRNGDPERAATHLEALLADFTVLLDEFEIDAPFDEHVIALETGGPRRRHLPATPGRAANPDIS
jgi:hypothetical protein